MSIFSICFTSTSKFIPTPKTIFLILFDSSDTSTSIPATFLPFMVKSFGHFNSGEIFNVFSNAFDNASADAIGNKVVIEISNFGCKIIESQIPPLGETHFLPDLPFPPVCFAAIITAPLFAGSPAIFSA